RNIKIGFFRFHVSRPVSASLDEHFCRTQPVPTVRPQFTSGAGKDYPPSNTTNPATKPADTPVLRCLGPSLHNSTGSPRRLIQDNLLCTRCEGSAQIWPRPTMELPR